MSLSTPGMSLHCHLVLNQGLQKLTLAHRHLISPRASHAQVTCVLTTAAGYGVQWEEHGHTDTVPQDRLKPGAQRAPGECTARAHGPPSWALGSTPESPARGRPPGQPCWWLRVIPRHGSGAVLAACSGHPPLFSRPLVSQVRPPGAAGGRPHGPRQHCQALIRAVYQDGTGFRKTSKVCAVAQEPPASGLRAQGRE